MIFAVGAKERTVTKMDDKHTNKRTESHACDLIDKQAAIDEIREWYEIRFYTKDHDEYLAVQDFCRAVSDHAKPSAQPETAKRIVGKSSRRVTMWYQCDMCKEPVDKEDAFCPGCGRRLLDA